MTSGDPALPDVERELGQPTAADEAREGWMDLALADGCSAALATASRRGRVPLGPRPEKDVPEVA